MYLVSGKAQLKLVCEEIGVALGDDEVDTVGGLVFHRLGRLPRPGDTIREGDALLTVEEVHGRRVASVKLELGTKCTTDL